MAGNAELNFPITVDVFPTHYDNTGEIINATDVNSVQTALVNIQRYLLDQGGNLRKTVSGRDANGIYVTTDYKRVDGTLYMRSVLSQLSGKNYSRDTWTFYDKTGIVPNDAVVWTLTYDVDGNVTDASPNK